MRRLRSRRSLYQNERALGEEERYILERQLAQRFPGNMLNRPSLLLNEWDIQSTETSQQRARAGEDFAAAADAEADAAAAPQAAAAQQRQVSGQANLDFLGIAAPVLTNLVPSEDGKVEVDLKSLGQNRIIQVVAVDPVTTAYRIVSLSDSTRGYADLRLAEGLETTRHFTRQKATHVIKAGDVFEIANVGSARFSAFDQLDDVYRLMLSTNPNEHLVEFEFILRWPELNDEEKRERYSKYACHELNFFLFKKDPEFFDKVIRPYLENKYQKTFLDNWLIDADLDSYLQPWAFEQLNVVERILLAQRLGKEPMLARHVRDLFEQQPKNVDQLNLLFDSGIANGNSWRYLRVPAEQRDQLNRQVEGSFGRRYGGTMTGVGGMVGGGAMGGSGENAFGLNQPGDPAGPAGRGGRWAAAPEEQEELRSEARLGERRSLRRKGLALDDRLADSDRDEDGAADDYFDRFGDVAGLVAEKKALGRFYLKLGATREWAENNYYRQNLSQQSAELVWANAFWLDYAERSNDKPFFSEHWSVAARNFTECMFALAVLDLPFKSEEHQIEFDGPRMTLKAGSPMIVLDEQVRPASDLDQDSPIQVSQNFYQRNDRHRQVDGQQRDKFVTGEFETHTVYGCQVAIGNGSSAPQLVEILTEIPVGAIPVNSGKYINTDTVRLEPYQTQTIEYEFYFPSPDGSSPLPLPRFSREPTLRIRTAGHATRRGTESGRRYQFLGNTFRSKRRMHKCCPSSTSTIPCYTIWIRLRFECRTSDSRSRSLTNSLSGTSTITRSGRTAFVTTCRQSWKSTCGTMTDSSAL